MLNAYINKSQLNLRNPFKILSLPLILKIYSLRKNKYSRNKAIAKIIKLIIPSAILRPALRFFSLFQKGAFEIESHETKKIIKFNISNTQFHSVYFPEYREGYEKETLAILDSFLNFKPDCTFYDIGANWGHFPMFAASNTAFKGSIYAFEPCFDTYKDLTEIVEQSGFNNINCFQMGIGDKDCQANISNTSSLNSGSAFVNYQSKGETIQVSTLDTFCSSETPPDIIKIDAEGFEAKIFQGAQKLFTEHRPMLIFENWLNLDDVQNSLHPITVLKEYGYKFYNPVFMYNNNGIEYLLDYENGKKYKHSDMFFLVEFTEKNRTLLNKQLNIVACHPENSRYIQELFTPAD